MSSKDGRIRKNILIGAQVQIIRKEDQKSGNLNKGKVAEILTNAPKHPHGIKVRLKSGLIGRVHKILSMKRDAVQGEAESVENNAKKIMMPWDRH